MSTPDVRSICRNCGKPWPTDEDWKRPSGHGDTVWTHAICWYDNEEDCADSMDMDVWDRMAELRAERDRLAAERDGLAAQLVEMEGDKGRLDKLGAMAESGDIEIHVGYTLGPKWEKARKVTIGQFGQGCFAPTLREAIDKAISASTSTTT